MMKYLLALALLCQGLLADHVRNGHTRTPHPRTPPSPAWPWPLRGAQPRPGNGPSDDDGGSGFDPDDGQWETIYEAPKPHPTSHPSDPQLGPHPSDPQLGPHPSDPQLGPHPSDPQLGPLPSSHPSGPQLGPHPSSHPSDPQFGPSIVQLGPGAVIPLPSPHQPLPPGSNLHCSCCDVDIPLLPRGRQYLCCLVGRLVVTVQRVDPAYC